MAKLPKYICMKVRVKDGLTVCLAPVEPEDVAADVRPVVHCVDCIYDDNCFAQSIFEEMSRIPFDKNKFFCADGKRREGGTP